MRILYFLLPALVSACADPGTGAAPDPDASSPIESDWERLPDVGGGPDATPIQEIGVAELDGRIYVIGGFSSQLQIVADVRVYDIASRTWSDAAPLPTPLHHANVAAAAGKLYVLGALAGLDFRPVDACYEYDPAADRWSELPCMGLEHARGSAAVGVIDDKIYLAGGLRGSAVADVSVYDPAERAWEHGLAPLPAPRDHLVGAAVDGILYAISGRDTAIDARTARVDAYDPATGEWTERAPIPTARGGAAAGVVRGAIIVAGGEGNDAVSSGVFSEVERYDPATDSWTALEPMPTPRHGMGAAGYEGTLYVPGGATVQAFGAVAVFEALTVP